MLNGKFACTTPEEFRKLCNAVNPDDLSLVERGIEASQLGAAFKGFGEWRLCIESPEWSQKTTSQSLKALQRYLELTTQFTVEISEDEAPNKLPKYFWVSFSKKA